MPDKLTYENDFLFKEAMLNYGVPNLYGTLIKKSDFEKSVPLHNMPYLRGRELNKHILDELLTKIPECLDGNHLKLRRALKFYMKQNLTKQWRNYRIWFNSKTYPMTLVRIICRLVSKDESEEKKNLSECLLKAGDIVNSKGEGSLKVSKLINNMINEDKAYIIGASFGDGCNLIDGLRWQITDGNKNLERLKYSHEYLLEINELLEREFGIKGTINKLEGNKYVLIVNNKWFSRLINYFYGVPFGKKSYLEIPKLFKDNRTRNSFWSGVIDTDGQVFDDSPNIQLCMKSKNLMEEFHEYLSLMKIEHNFRHFRDEFYILIPVRSFKLFNQIFKISHPCKSMLVNNNLEKGTKQRTFTGKKNRTMGQFITSNKYIIKTEGDGIRLGMAGKNFVKVPPVWYLDAIAPRIRTGDRKIYIINRGKVESRIIANEMERIFGIKSYYNKSKNTYYFNSDVLCGMFKYLYKYEKPW